MFDRLALPPPGGDSSSNPTASCSELDTGSVPDLSSPDSASDSGEEAFAAADAAMQPSVPSFTCRVCMDKSVQSIFLPCGHFCACEDCSATLMQSEKNCPICRGKIHGLQRVYF